MKYRVFTSPLKSSDCVSSLASSQDLLKQKKELQYTEEQWRHFYCKSTSFSYLDFFNIQCWKLQKTHEIAFERFLSSQFTAKEECHTELLGSVGNEPCFCPVTQLPVCVVFFFYQVLPHLWEPWKWRLPVYCLSAWVHRPVLWTVTQPNITLDEGRKGKGNSCA